jgi:protein-L-isoaspartate(D-aspartate) O-methyltransferase
VSAPGFGAGLRFGWKSARGGLNLLAVNRMLHGWVAAAIASGTLSCTVPQPERDALVSARLRMVEQLQEDEGLHDERVLTAMREVPRHWFVPRRLQPMAYYDIALPIGRGQTLTPPSMVAGVVDRLDLEAPHKVLEVGTGTGYQAAVLSRLAGDVYSIEIEPALAHRARATLKRLGCQNVQVRTGDGYQGWPEHAPFDRIIVACSPETVPVPLIQQLREGGKLIVPLGTGYDQMLFLMTKTNGVLVREAVGPIAFVPMTGRAELDREQPLDALEPALVNGGFEVVQPSTARPASWYHQRQVKLVAADAPEGQRYAVFENATPGRTSEASQALAVDGRQVRALALSGLARGSEIQRGTETRSRASVVLAFYDAHREPIGAAALGDWIGTFDWQPFEYSVEVPAASREAVLRVGLSGATGRLAVDGLRLTVVR